MCDLKGPLPVKQHPDGSYEYCPLAPALARWAQALARRVQGLHEALRIHASSDEAAGCARSSCCEGGCC